MGNVKWPGDLCAFRAELLQAPRSIAVGASTQLVVPW